MSIMKLSECSSFYDVGAVAAKRTDDALLDLIRGILSEASPDVIKRELERAQLERLPPSKGDLIAEFLAKFRGIDASYVARALNELTPGINWSRAPKSRMAERWADARVTKAVHYGRLMLVELPILSDAVYREVHVRSKHRG